MYCATATSTVASPSLCVSNTDVCEATPHQHIIPVPHIHIEIVVLRHQCIKQWHIRVLHTALCVGQLFRIVADNVVFCAAVTSQKVVEPFVPAQRFDSQPHAESTVGVSSMLSQEVMPHDVFG